MESVQIERPFLRLKEVMELTGLAESTIWKHIRTGKFIQPYKFLGRIVMFKKSELLEWMESQKC